MTLVELLVSVMVTGTIVAVLSSAIVVFYRQRPATEGRLNVARAEQSVGLWVPADLASATTVDTDPAASPCGTACPPNVVLDGSNAMMLTWQTTGANGAVSTTKVSYHFAPAGDGLYELRRVECNSSGGAWTCQVGVVLHDLPGPPGGATFVAKQTSPTWVILVSEPLAANATSESQLASGSQIKNAKRVVVTINGGGTDPGAGGGINQISITAGGTTRTQIDANSVQGAPTFADARSRCGGPIALVVDESNSIGSSITQVRDGVRRFIEALAGTPVTLQLVRFHTYSSILGDNAAWQRYYDMTKDADVTALLGAVNNLQGSWSNSPNGGTNWEEALYRTFYNADGTTAATIPDTMLFFTDGVPTFDRLVYRSSPGIIPSQPPVPTAPWATSNGSVYSQVAFDRANYLATQFRSSVRFIGVGVGNGITSSSTWISDPGAGYRTVWERGSWTYQASNGYTYQARYQTRPSSSSNTWSWVTKSTYDRASGSRRRDQGWTDVSQAIYNSLESPPNDVSTDGLQRIAAWTPISTTEYNAKNTTANESDGYRANPSGKTYAAPYLDWETWTGTRSGATDQYRSTKLYNSPPYEGYDPAVTAQTANSIILARLIAGNDNGVPAIWNGTTYTNPEQADMYVLPQWTQFGKALEAVALGECGGTLTLQTKLNGTTAAPDPFTYQNSGVKDSAGNPVTIEPSVVRTNQQFVTGTFDFSIPNGQYVTVEIRPENLSDLGAYRPLGWTCKAALTNRPVTAVPIDGTQWSGIQVKVAANEAVSCTLSVARN
ncbi:MAG: vWA domain-containing protein [Ilumatobacteraceae bacterium]